MEQRRVALSQKVQEIRVARRLAADGLADRSDISGSPIARPETWPRRHESPQKLAMRAALDGLENWIWDGPWCAGLRAVHCWQASPWGAAGDGFWTEVIHDSRTIFVAKALVIVLAAVLAIAASMIPPFDFFTFQ